MYLCGYVLTCYNVSIVSIYEVCLVYINHIPYHLENAITNKHWHDLMFSSGMRKGKCVGKVAMCGVAHPTNNCSPFKHCLHFLIIITEMWIRVENG